MDDKPQSWRRLGLIGAISTLLAVVSVAAAVYMFPDRLVKPLLLERLRSALAADVSIDYLEVDGLKLAARGVEIRSEGLTASAPAASASLLIDKASWAGAALELENPTVTMRHIGGKETLASERSFFFDVKEGRLEYAVGNVTLRATDVNGRFSLGKERLVDLSANVLLSENAPPIDVELKLEDREGRSRFTIASGSYDLGVFSIESGAARGTLEESGVVVDSFEIEGLAGKSGENLWRAERASGSLSFAPAGAGWRYSVDSRIDSPEALVGVTALSIGKATVALRASGAYEEERLSIAEASASVPDLLVVALRGELARAGSKLEIETEMPFGTIIQRIFPGISVSPLPGARDPGVSVFAALDIGEELSLSGHVVANGLGLSSSGRSIEIISSRVPVWLGTHARAPSPAVGWARIRSAAGFGAEIERADIALRAVRDGLDLERPLEIRYGDGDVVLRDVSLAFRDSRPRLVALLSANRIDSPVLGARFSAEARLAIDPREITATDLVVRSEIGMARFERTVVSDPFGFPRVETGLSLSGVDLGRLSHGLEIGTIHGVLDGEVRSLEIEGGVPVRFHATLRTRDRGERSISVTAINNLSVISQGAIMSTLSQGIYRFIDSYRYKSIGIDARLSGDVFELAGTALAGSDRYLVYGGLLPPKIDIVAPDGTIPFSQLVERVGRVTRAGDPALEVR